MKNVKLYNLVNSFRNAVQACLPDGDEANDISSIVKEEITEHLSKFEEQLEVNGHCTAIPFVPCELWDQCKPPLPEALYAETRVMQLTRLLHEIDGFAGNHLRHVEFLLMAIHYEIGKRFIVRKHGVKPELLCEDDDNEDSVETFDCIRCGDTRTQDEYYSHNICAYCAHVTR